jgi:hypothetical protein
VARDPGESGFGTSGLLVSKGSQQIRETPNCEGPPRCEWVVLTGGIAVRGSGLGRSCERCNRGREFSIGDFPSSTGVWGPSVSSEDKWHRRSDILEFGVRDFIVYGTRGIASADFPIGKSPKGMGALTFDHRGSGN